MKTLILVALAAALALNGCATLHLDNYEDGSLNQEEMRFVAKDGSDMLAAHYPPGKTTLALNPAGPFGQYLIDALRAQGFGVEEQAPVTLYYLLDVMDGQQYRLGLITKTWRSDASYRRDSGNMLVRADHTQRVAQ